MIVMRLSRRNFC